MLNVNHIFNLRTKLIIGFTAFLIVATWINLIFFILTGISVVFARDMNEGTVLSLDDLDVKRPGTGFPPEKIDELVGAKLLRNVEANMLVLDSDILMK